MVKIDANDTWLEIAKKIFYKSENLQNFVVTGYTTMGDMDIEETGELVKQHLIKLDLEENCEQYGDGRLRRKRKKPPHTIGGFDAQIQIKYERRVLDGKPRWQFWRMQ